MSCYPSQKKSAAPKTEAGTEPSPAKTESPRETASLPPAVPAEGKKARIVIVIDDLGIDRPRTARAIRLPGPLTMSFLTYAPDLDKQTRAAGDAGRGTRKQRCDGERGSTLRRGGAAVRLHNPQGARAASREPGC